MSPDEWARCFAAFGPNVPDEDQLARRIRNPDEGLRGMDLLRSLDVVDQLPRIDRPTLVCVGELEAGTPVEASREIVDGLRAEIRRFEIVPEAGHFPWLDEPELYFGILTTFLREAADREG